MRHMTLLCNRQIFLSKQWHSQHVNPVRQLQQQAFLLLASQFSLLLLLYFFN